MDRHPHRRDHHGHGRQYHLRLQGRPPPFFGSVSPATFTRGTATVGVGFLAYNSGTGGKLTFQITRTAGTTPSDGLIGSGPLTLTLGSETFAIPSPGTLTQFEFDPGGLSWNSGDTVAVSLAIDSTNNAPVITTTSPISVPENTTAVTTLTATDADTGTTLTWSKNGGADADAFTLTTDGVLTFTTAPDYENPTDTGSNNSYVVIVQVSDATATADLTLTVNVTDVAENQPPVITTTSPLSVPENTTAVVTLAATDPDTSDTLTWSKNGGADADAFTLTAGGVLSFATAPDFEAPTDTGGDNGYVVIVRVTDGTDTADLTLTVNVTDVPGQTEEAQAQTMVPAGWSLIPSGARAGDDFRLLIVTSTRQTAANTDIADYNAVVQNDVSNTGHADIQGYAANFRMLGCTQTVSAITNANTGSTDPAASIYYLNGAKVADDYADLYDGSWDSNAPKFPDGENAPTSGLISQTLVGCTPAGMIDGTNHLAAALVTQGYPGFSGSEFGVFPVLVKESRRFYGLSEIFRVPANTAATGAPAITGTAAVGETLTASTGGIMDADGLSRVSYGYRWIRLDSDGMMNPTDIGTDASTYTLVAADVGKKIQVGVSFQDDSGNDEALTSTAYPSGIATVPAVAAPATGAPAITGTARVGQTLTASTGGIMDADGLSRVSYGYRWIRVDSDGMMNPTDIGTDASTYTLVAADEGKKIQVEVSFQDDRGNDEELTSEAYPSGTETIAAADTTNNAPTFTDGPSTSRSIAENTASGQNIGAPITATDADTGDTLTYDLGGTDAAAFGIVSASGQIQTRAALDYETKSSYTVTVTVSDGNGGSDSIDVTINVTPDDGGGDDGGGDGGDGEPTTSVPGPPTNLTAVVGDGQVVLSWDTPESDGGADITDYEYRINGRNPWISIGSTETTHTVTGLDNGTEYTFQVRAVNRVGKSFAPSQTEATPGAPELLSLDFAHFANGNGINSELVFVNTAPQPVRPTIYFYDTEGALVSAESVVDLTGDLEVTEDGGLTVLTEMEPLGELTIPTHGRGELVTGSVKVISGAPIGGGLRFDLPHVGMAVTGAGPPIGDAIFPVRRREGGINTGVAIHNLEEEPMEVSCRLMRGGAVLEQVSLPLEANGQTSWPIDQAFPAADTSDFTGSVRCDTVGEGRFSAVALEMDPGTRTFIVLPVFPVNRSAGGQAAVLDFAHFVNGDGATSDLVFVNPSTQPSRPGTPFISGIPAIRPAIYFYDTEGGPIAAASVVDLTADLEIREDGGLTVRTEMEPLGVLTISTHGRGEVVTGSVRVVSDSPIGGMLRFDLPHIGEAVVGTGPPIGDAIFPVRRREEGITTGVAIHNLESSSELVRCELLREGVLLDSVMIPLEANGQTSWTIDAAFPTTDTSDFTGSVRCDAVGEGLFTAIALEMDPGARTFITLPLFPVEERTDQE